MTWISDNDVTCCNSGKSSNQAAICSTNSQGSIDLDTRPPEMERSTLCYEIQRCPSCGYCSTDLSICDGNIQGIIESTKYQSIINEAPGSEVTCSFLALSYLQESNKQYGEAAWNAIHASWISDDENNSEFAIQCRKRAVFLIESANAEKQKLVSEEGVTELISIDLMRRAKMFQEAEKLIKLTLKKDIEGVVLQVINFERTLIKSKNIDAHTVSKALNEE